MNIWEIDARIEEILQLEEEELVDNETGEIILVSDKLEQLEMERDKKIENAALAVKNMTAEVNAIKAEEKALYERRKALENRTESFKRFLMMALTRADGTHEKFSTCRAAVSVKFNPPSVVISDEAILPHEFMREKITVSPDKAQIKEVLMRGIEIPGASIERGRSVVIR